MQSKWIEYCLSTNKLVLARKMGWAPKEEVLAAVVVQSRWRAVCARREVAPALARRQQEQQPLWAAVSGWLKGLQL